MHALFGARSWSSSLQLRTLWGALLGKQLLQLAQRCATLPQQR